MYNVSSSCIVTILQKQNVKLQRGKITYTQNNNFFDNINNEQKAYWLGVLFADGCIKKITENSKVITFSSIDKEWVEQYKYDIESNGKILTEHHKKYNKDIYKLNIFNCQLFDSLNKLGCTPNKSLTIKFPNIKEDLIHHFIRGYFDGDGTVGVYNYIKGYNKKTLRCGVFCGSEIFLKKMIDYIPVKTKNIKHYTRKNNVYYFRFSVKDSLAFSNYIYKNATVYLKRKKDIFDQYKRDAQRL